MSPTKNSEDQGIQSLNSKMWEKSKRIIFTSVIISSIQSFIVNFRNVINLHWLNVDECYRYISW